MNTRFAVTLGPVMLALSVLTWGTGISALVAATGAQASARQQSRTEHYASRAIMKARAALARRQFAKVIAHAETAVTYEPDAADYRMILGQGYLKAGRFQSARDAFADTLSLAPTNGKAALQFALMQIASGDWAGARITLETYASIIPVKDRGLAVALAGDPVAAVEMLGPAARLPDADAKTRQNFALALGLAGRWREAQVVVAIDVAPADVAHRLLEWSTFSRPASASDQVSALLGITPVADAGQPSTVALHRGSPSTTPHPTDDAEPAQGPPSGEASRPTPVADHQVGDAPVMVATAAADAPAIQAVVFAPRKDVVQALPLRPTAVPAVAPLRTTSVVAPRSIDPVHPGRVPTKGSFYVQLGAFDNAAVAHDAWIRAVHRFAALGGHVPQGMGITAGGTTYYRLSVGGFTRDDAVAMCRAYRARAGRCFVRAGAGDQMAMWARGGQLAFR